MSPVPCRARFELPVPLPQVIDFSTTKFEDSPVFYHTPGETFHAQSGTHRRGLLLSVSVFAEDKVVHVYNWSDYIAEDTLANFQQATGVKAVYDVYDSNETLEAKLLAGHSGYDVVFPSLQPFAKRHIEAGVYAELDKAALPNLVHVDDAILKEMAAADPGSDHLVPYMWGTSGIGYNIAMVMERLGEAAPTDSWALIFEPRYAEKLADCGISLFDDEIEVFAALLIGYPMALGIARAHSSMRVLLLMLIVLPFWTSFLIRVYAWIGLLKNNGLINNLLLALGLIDQPLPLLHSDFAVYLGIVYSYLPFMVLPLYANLVRLDPTLLEAAADLGCRRSRPSGT